MMKFVFYFIGIVLFLIVVFWLSPRLSDSDCRYRDEFRSVVIKGSVKRRFIDSTEHSYPIVEYMDINSDSLKTLNLVLERSGIFEKIDQNDFLVKHKQSDTLYVTKNGNNKRIFVAEYDCR